MDEKRILFIPSASQRLEAMLLPSAKPYFLANRLHFYLLLAIIGTTLVSWFQLNSILIILLTCCRLLEGWRPASVVRTAFSDRRFQAFFVLFLLEVCGLLHAHNLYMGWKHVESKATLVAIPLIICSGSFTDGPGFQRLMRAYCRLLAALCLGCLGWALLQYGRTEDPGVFFYHSLTEPLQANAVFFSAYLLMALLYLLSTGALRDRGRSWLLLFFTAMMVLLSSKLLLVLLVVVFAFYLWRRRGTMPRWKALGLAACLFLGTAVLSFTDNPVMRRYKDVLVKERSVSGRSIGHLFNGVSIRLFIWKTADKILNENHAWVFGVSAGDSQDLLDQHYYRVGMDEGFLGYNFHNEYIELLVSSGVVGLCVFLGALVLLCRSLGRRATAEGWFAIAVILLLACTESSLEMQQPAFLSCFFPLLPWWLLKEKNLRRVVE